MVRLLSALLSVAGLLSAQVSFEDLKNPKPEDWLTYGRTYDSQRHSPLTEITPENVNQLQAAWIYPMPSTPRLQAVPIVVDGVMYVSGVNEVHAIDARTGRNIWTWNRRPAVNRGPERGVSVLGDKVYVSTPDAYLVALDARTGSEIWASKIAETKDGYYSPAATFAIDGKIIAGTAAGDYGLNGWLDAFDAETGERLWRWYTIPRPGEPGNETWAGDSWKTGGGATWLTGSYDPDLNLLYWGIGNPAPDFYGDDRLGDNLYTESVVAINADTGKLVWHFQFTPHDVHDWDSVEIPILVDAEYKGKMRDGARRQRLLLRAGPRDRRVSARHAVHRPAQLGLRLTDKGRPIRVPGWSRRRRATSVCPSTSGATNWMSPAYNPATGCSIWP